jgi:hypothetical protein
MSLLSWLRGQLNADSSHHAQRRPSRKAARRPRSVQRLRPQVEALEGRSLLATLTVTNSGDSDAGSLRSEIELAQTGDTIVFDKSLSGQNIALLSELRIDKDLDIEGLGANQLAVSGGIDFEGPWRVFEVTAGASVTIAGLTIQNGRAPDAADPNAGGGGILNAGTLTLIGCTLRNNTAHVGGAISNTGVLVVDSCLIASNSAVNGGGIDNTGTLRLSGTTVTGNHASSRGGGIYNAGNATGANYTSVTHNTALVGADLFEDPSGSFAWDKHSRIGKIAK